MATYVELITSDLPGFDPGLAKVVTVKGQLDESNVDDEAKKIYAVLEGVGDKFTLLLDFKDLEYMNSKAVGYLTDWYTKLTDKQGKVLVVQPRENILDILQVVGLTQLIQVYGTMEEARLALGQGAAPAAGEAPVVVAPAEVETPAATPEAAVPATPEATPAVEAPVATPEAAPATEEVAPAESTEPAAEPTPEEAPVESAEPVVESEATPEAATTPEVAPAETAPAAPAEEATPEAPATPDSTPEVAPTEGETPAE